MLLLSPVPALEVDAGWVAKGVTESGAGGSTVTVAIGACVAPAAAAVADGVVDGVSAHLIENTEGKHVKTRRVSSSMF